MVEILVDKLFFKITMKTAAEFKQHQVSTEDDPQLGRPKTPMNK